VSVFTYSAVCTGSNCNNCNSVNVIKENINVIHGRLKQANRPNLAPVETDIRETFSPWEGAGEHF
jgi:hypothetical protein